MKPTQTFFKDAQAAYINVVMDKPKGTGEDEKKRPSISAKNLDKIVNLVKSSTKNVEESELDALLSTIVRFYQDRGIDVAVEE